MQWVWDLSSRRRRLKTFFDIFILWTFRYIRPLAARDDDVEVTAAVGDRKDIFLMMFFSQVFLFDTLLKSYQMCIWNQIEITNREKISTTVTRKK